MNKPAAYISQNGTLFKELPPEPMDLIPLYSDSILKQIIDSQRALIEEYRKQMPLLTDDEIDENWFGSNCSYKKFAKMIEAKIRGNK